MEHLVIWLIGFGVTAREILRVEISEKLPSQQKNIEIWYFQVLSSCY